ncbi:MAG: nickel-dependent lactate racemase [Candidatus Bathyarchaeia archaeon]
MKVKLRYGERFLNLELKDEKIVFDLDIADHPSIQNMEDRLRLELKRPHSSHPISSIAGAESKVALLVDDLTRPTPQSILLPIILGELEKAGVKSHNVKVIVALGTHRPMSSQEIEDRFGEVAEKYEVVNHDPKDSKALTNIGATGKGFPIMINRELWEANLTIGVGNIVPHMYAGWAGGGKIVLPGVSGEQTTGGIHLLGGRIRPAFKFLGRLDHEVRRLIDEVALKSRLGYIVNTVLNRDRRVCGLTVGHPVEAFKKGVAFAEKIYRQTIPEPADLVIVSSYPADVDYWQAIKGVVSASLAVKPGGVVLLVTPCPEGISPTHRAMREYGSYGYEELNKMVEEGDIEDAVAAGTLLYHAQLREKARIIIYSDGLKEKDAEALGVAYAGDFEEGLKLAEEFLGEKKPKIGLIRNSEVLPTLPI